MTELYPLLLASSLFMGLVFLIAFAAEKLWIPQKILHHPLVYTLSLGGYIGAWSVFGVFELASANGYTFLAYYVGTSILFLFSPLLLQPLLNLSRTHQLSSLADLFSFRYCSQSAGMLVAAGTLIAVMPLMALQINAVAESSTFLQNLNAPREDISRAMAILFCTVIAFFTVRFGSRHINTSMKHEGLIAAIAFQSLVKLLLLLFLGFIALFYIFGSPAELESWLAGNPDKLAAMNASSSNNQRTLMLIFAAATLAFPHMYHLAFTENRDPKSLRYASWAFPLYLLLLSLPVLPILWASIVTDSHDRPYFYLLQLGEVTATPFFTILAYLCGLAAASASMMVITIAVASICLNHLILPFHPLHTHKNTYVWLRRIKSLLMCGLLLLAYFSYELISQTGSADQFDFAAYTAAFQFLPGILAVVFWPKGNDKGVIAGLSAGFSCWGILIALPIISPEFRLPFWEYQAMESAITSLGINMFVFGLVSLLTTTGEEQKSVARNCAQDDLGRPVYRQLSLHSVPQFISRLAEVIGEETARREVTLALTRLNMSGDENRPFALRLLRRQLESNLSGLLGPTVARQLVSEQLPYCETDSGTEKDDIQLIEHQLESYHSHFTGLAAELDNLRRYHRNTVERLPLGVCTLNDNREILMWNHSMQKLTGIAEKEVIGSSIQAIPQPWHSLFLEFLQGNGEQQQQQILFEQGIRWFSLHKTHEAGGGSTSGNQTLLMEEVTETVMLEKELLHNERLASLGRLAAGVAHEIGNPVTGIACLAQNLKYDSDKPEIAEAARDILTQTERISRIVQSLVNFSHAGNHSRQLAEPANLYQCADDAIHLLSLEKSSLARNIANRIDPDHNVRGDSQGVLQVFINLLKNAMDACKPVTDREAVITLTSIDHGQTIEIRITDNGPGIPEGMQEKVFDPFFTTKEPGQGTGLGLSLVYSIIEEHSGLIHVVSPPDRNLAYGTCFIIQLPKHATA